MFKFFYQPEVLGNWTIDALWKSDKGYYLSAYSNHNFLEVVVPEIITNSNDNELPYENVMIAFLGVLIIIIIAIYILWTGKKG